VFHPWLFSFSPVVDLLNYCEWFLITDEFSISSICPALLSAEPLFPLKMMKNRLE